MPGSGRYRKKALPVWQRLRNWSRFLKRDIVVLYYALKHPRTPWYARMAAAIVVGYALSPVDLIPDFLPVLGYLDDIILLPLGIALVIRLVPPAVMALCREQAARSVAAIKPKIWAAAMVIIGLWLVAAYFIYSLLASSFE